MNALMVLVPYQLHGCWVFDDPAKGLKAEPFVAGIDTIIENAVEDIPNAHKGFKLIFSAVPFPGHKLQLDWLYPDSGGNWYNCKSMDQRGWLCPALYKYFAEAPKTLYADIQPLPAELQPVK